MEIYMYILIFILGCVLGSFYNVLAYRIPRHESIIFPSSHCPSCKHELKFFDLIPIISYLILGGKCHYCKKKISAIYPIIELITGILFLISYICFGLSIKFIEALITSSVCVITIASDIRYMIIEDKILLTGGILILLLSLFGKTNSFFDYLLNGIISFVIFFIVKFSADHLFKKEAMGGGDVKLLTFFGMIIDYKMSVITLCLSAFIAFPYAIFVFLKKDEHILPLGPFLCIAALILYFWGLKFDDLMIIMAG